MLRAQAVDEARAAGATELSALHAEYVQKLDAVKAEMMQKEGAHAEAVEALEETHRKQNDLSNRALLASAKEADSRREAQEQVQQLKIEVAELKQTIVRLTPASR